MKPLVIGLTGKPGSGKGTVSTLLEKDLKRIGKTGQIIRFGDPLAEICDTLGLERTRANMQTLGTYLAQALGDDVLPNALAKRMESGKVDVYILDGVRRSADAALADILIGISVRDMTTRYERVKNRQTRSDERQKTIVEFEKEDGAETEREIDALVAKADFRIYNNDSLPELRKSVQSIFSQIFCAMTIDTDVPL